MPTFKMHADEADIDEALVRRLVAAQFPQWSGLAVERVASSGTENAMYRLGEDLAVRLPRIEGAQGNVTREQRWLRSLAPHLPVRIPEPVCEGRPGQGFPWKWSVFRWLEGVNPQVGEIDEPDRLAEDLAGFITALRRITPHPDAPPAGRGVPLALRDPPTRKAIEDLGGLIDTRAATRAWEYALKLPESCCGVRSWVHGDLGPGNLLLVGGQLHAVIDFGGVGVGDPTVDLIAAWNLLPAQGRAVLRAGLEADDDTWERGRGWALSIALIQLPYYQHTNAALAANSRHVIAEVLADHEQGPTR